MNIIDTTCNDANDTIVAHIDPDNAHEDRLFVSAEMSSRVVHGRRVWSAKLTGWAMGGDSVLDELRPIETLDPEIAGLVKDHIEHV